MISLALALSLTVVSASSAVSPSAWPCAYAAERLPRTLALLGENAVSAGETRAARKRLGLPEGVLTRASALSLARALGGSRLVLIRCEEDRNQTAIEARSFEVDRPAAGVVARATRPRAEIAAAIDEVATQLASVGTGAAPAAFPSPLPATLAATGPALSATSPGERARGLAAALALDPASIDLRLSAVEALIAARDFDAAIRLAGAAPPAGTPPALGRALRYQAGAAQLEAGRYAEASATFDTLRRAQETAAVLNNLGVARFRLRDPGASALFGRAGSFSDPRQNDISFNRALALLFEGKAEQALPALDRALEAAPRDAQVRLLKVWGFRLLNRETERGEEWERLMAIAPSFASLGTPDLARRLERIFYSERIPGP